MIKALSFCAFLIIGLWYGPWWSITLLGIFYGLVLRERSPLVFSSAYGLLGFLTFYALIWISDSHSGLKVGLFLTETAWVPPFVLYAVSALLYTVVLWLSCLTGAYWGQVRRARY